MDKKICIPFGLVLWKYYQEDVVSLVCMVHHAPKTHRYSKTKNNNKTNS